MFVSLLMMAVLRIGIEANQWYTFLEEGYVEGIDGVISKVKMLLTIFF